MSTLTPSPKMAFFDNNGDPLVGGQLYTYLSGTTTPVFTKTTAVGDINNTNPVILDARGEASVWLDEATVYRFVLKTATDVELWTSDGISGFLTPAAKGLNRFTANGSFTVPAGVTKIWISGVAGGGGGGGSGYNTTTGALAGSGGGGGAGQASIKKVATVTPGEVIPITIGTRGFGGNAGHTVGPTNATAGASGSNTIIGTYLTLVAGAGGDPGNNGSLTLSAGVYGGGGGIGSVYGAMINGQGGGEGSPVGPHGGMALPTSSGAGGSNPFGFGALGRRISYGAVSVIGNDGRGYGSGGAGGGVSANNSVDGAAGGDGADGMVIIEW